MFLLARVCYPPPIGSLRFNEGCPKKFSHRYTFSLAPPWGTPRSVIGARVARVALARSGWLLACAASTQPPALSSTLACLAWGLGVSARKKNQRQPLRRTWTPFSILLNTVPNIPTKQTKPSACKNKAFIKYYRFIQKTDGHIQNIGYNEHSTITLFSPWFPDHSCWGVSIPWTLPSSWAMSVNRLVSISSLFGNCL